MNRPETIAPKQAWVAYAAAEGHGDLSAGLKAQIIAVCDGSMAAAELTKAQPTTAPAKAPKKAAPAATKKAQRSGR